MDGFMAEMVAGLMGLMALLVGALGVLFKRWMDQSDASQAIFQADVKEEIRGVKTALDRDYLLREPHMQAHETLKGRLDAHGVRLTQLEERVVQLERKP